MIGGIIACVVLGVLIFLILKKYIHSQSLLHSQCEKGETEGVKWHLEQGADVNAPYKGITLLHTAAAYNHKEIVELVIAEGADVNAKDDNGTTPLHDAVGYLSQKEIIELLIANGADMNAMTKHGYTPLDWAEEVNEDASLEDKADYRELAYILRKHGGKTGEELKTEGE